MVGVTAVTPDGHVIVGGCVSTTVTVKLQLPVWPRLSVVVQVTVVVPFGKNEPLAGEHTGAPGVEHELLVVGGG